MSKSPDIYEKPKSLNEGKLNRQRLESLLKLKISDVSFNKTPLTEALAIIRKKCMSTGDSHSIKFLLKDKRSAKDSLIDLYFKSISVEQLLRYICLSSGLDYHLGEFFTIVLSQRSKLSEQQEVVTKFYAPPTWVEEEMKNYAGGKETAEYAHFFNKIGMTFPTGSKLDYLPNVRRLVLTNTQGNHDILQDSLSAYLTVTSQIKVHIELVEVKDNNSLLLKKPGHITRELLMSLASNERQTIAQMDIVAVSGKTAFGKDYLSVEPIKEDNKIGHFFEITSTLEPDGSTITSHFEWLYSDLSPQNKERQLSIETIISISNGSSVVFQVQQADGIDKRNLYLVISENLIGLDGQLIK